MGGPLRGHNADAVIICEPSQHRVCPAQTGGRTSHLTLRGNNAGILYEGEPPIQVTEQLRYLLGKIEEFAEQRRALTTIHPLYSDSTDTVPVWVTKISCGGWGTQDVFHQHFATPAVLFGPRGGNTHAPDEWVDLDSALVVTETLARFICRWCGVEP